MPSLTRQEIVSPAPAPPTVLRRDAGKHRLVYILAASHSGSTLLTMLLGAHPEICTVGELKLAIPGDIQHYMCSCGQTVHQCPFWNRIKQDMAKRGIPFDIAAPDTDIGAAASAYVRWLLRPLHRGPRLERFRDFALALSPRWRRARQQFAVRTAALVAAVCNAYDCSIIVDSSKYALRLKYLLRNPALDIRIIRLIRDGRAVAATYHVDENRLGMRAAAREWRRSNEEAEQLLATLDPTVWSAARYEELCTEPRRTLARLCTFIGVDPARATLDFRSPGHHVIGNWMRTQPTREIRLDDRWRVELSADDVAEFDAGAGVMNRRYGYH